MIRACCLVVTATLATAGQARGLTYCDTYYLRVEAWIAAGHTLDEKQKSTLRMCLDAEKKAGQVMKDARDKAQPPEAGQPQQDSK